MLSIHHSKRLSHTKAHSLWHFVKLARCLGFAFSFTTAFSMVSCKEQAPAPASPQPQPYTNTSTNTDDDDDKKDEAKDDDKSTDTDTEVAVAKDPTVHEPSPQLTVTRTKGDPTVPWDKLSDTELLRKAGVGSSHVGGFASTYVGDTDSQESLRLVALGGASHDAPGQLLIGQAMTRLCQQAGCDSALLLGDTFAPPGILTDDDAQFRDRFETPYKELNIPFFPVIGERDLHSSALGGIFGRPSESSKSLLSYQGRSQKWRLTSQYYDVPIGRVHLFAIDTLNFNESQQQWLKERLRASTAVWKIVFGYHAIYSYGARGGSAGLEKALLPILCSHAQMYVAGNERSHQVLRSDCGVHLVVTGAGSKGEAVASGPRTLFADSRAGFMRLIINPLGAQLGIFDGAGLEIHSETLRR